MGAPFWPLSMGEPAPAAVTTEALAEAWKGHIPTVFTLAPDEVATLEKPRPFHACLPRQALLPLAIDAARAHFEKFAPPIGGEMWFEYADEPLRWQLPVGVLFDLMVGEDDGEALPWEVTVHFQRFPQEAVLRATGTEAEAVLLNALKESCWLRCGSAMPAMTLTPDKQSCLAAAIRDSDVGGFTEVRELIDAGCAAQLEANSRAVRHVPVRVLTSPTSWRQAPMRPAPKPAAAAPAAAPAEGAGAAGAEPTPAILRHALHSLLPAHFAALDADADAAAAEPRVLVQGVRVPLDTPLDWLWEACAHPDGWLYVGADLPPEKRAAAAVDAS